MALGNCAALLGDRVVPKARDINWTTEGKTLNEKAIGQYKVLPEDVARYNIAMNFNTKEGREALVRMGISKDKVYEKITAARQLVNEGATSKSLFYNTKTGWATERKTIHREIREELLKMGDVAAKGEKPRVILTGGIPGSGKSSMMKNDVYAKRFEGYVHLDADDIKKTLAIRDGYDKVTWQAALYHDESSDVVMMTIKDAVAQGKNIIYDGTMKKTGKIVELVDEFKKAGYTVEVAYADLPMEKAMVRATERFIKEEGRFVDPVYVASNGSQNIKSYETIKDKVDVYRKWDTDVKFGQKAKLVEEGGRGL